MSNEKSETVFWILLTAYTWGGPSTPKPVNGAVEQEGRRFGSQSVDMYISEKGPRESFSDRRCLSTTRFPSFCLWVLWWPSRDVRMCHGRRWRVCARVSVHFFVCVRVRVVVSLGKVHGRAAQRSLSGEEVGEGHSQPLSLIMWASSMMNLPSLYFWLHDDNFTHGTAA